MRKRMPSLLLTLVMLLSLLPTTALAAGYQDVGVNGIQLRDAAYLADNSSTSATTGANTEPSNYVAWYKNGVLTLNGYNGKYIQVSGISKSDLTVKLKGSNTITSSYRAGIIQNGKGGSITVTADKSSNGKLTIDATYSYTVAGIDNGTVGSDILGDVTIKGYADVTIKAKTTGNSSNQGGYGIYAKNAFIQDNASVNIACETPNHTSGELCYGIYAKEAASINTAGKIKINVTNAGTETGNAHSYGINVANRSLTLTKAAEMVVEWRNGPDTSTAGAPYYPTKASFNATDHAINVDTTNCYASYRYGEPRTVMVNNGKLDGPGVVPYAKNNGNFLAGDKVNIKPNEKKSNDNTLIPFKEWTAEGVTITNATSPSNSFTVPGNNVTVTATYNPFDGAPVFTRTDDSSGKIEVKTVAKLDNSEFFQYVKDGETTYKRPYSQPTTTSEAFPYQYIFNVTTYNFGDIRKLDAGEYRMVVTLNGEEYLSEKFTVSYAAPVTTYTVSFDANGGTGTMADATGVSGDYELPVCGFTAPNGKQFKAWSVGGVEKAVGDKITVTANTTVTAVWEDIPVVTYTVSFDANGGTGTMADVTSVTGSYTLPACTFTAPSDKQFKGWATSASGAVITDTSINVTENTTLYAIWEPIPVSKPAITTISLPDGKVGDAYSQTLAATGTNPITWGIEAGTLPDGLTLVGDTIKGTPSKAGDFKFTVKATNSGGSVTKELTIKVADAEAAKYHNVTLTDAGTGATGAGSHAAGTTVNIYAGTKSGYTFNGWTSDNVTVLSASSKNASFVMPNKDVTVKANWVYNGGGSSGGGYTYYTIKATAGVNGSISPTGNVSVREGRDQTFTITPDKGYAVAKVLIDSKNVGAVKSYTFENVKKNHTIEVVFMKASGNPQTGVFVDVPEGSYYEEAVNWAVEKGITTGTDATHFSPDGICTRAQAVTFLWRAAGSPAAKSAVMPFTDVKAGSYYYDAVLWAVENGITKGTSDTMFSPDATCSRAQIVTFLWRSQKSPAAGTANPFTDVKASAYYADAVLWAVKEDVTKGTTNTTFSPDANCTRAQIVTFIWRALAE